MISIENNDKTNEITKSKDYYKNKQIRHSQIQNKDKRKITRNESTKYNEKKKITRTESNFNLSYFDKSMTNKSNMSIINKTNISISDSVSIEEQEVSKTKSGTFKKFISIKN